MGSNRWRDAGREGGLPSFEKPVRQKRLEKGLSQKEVAGRVGITRQALHSIETGRYVPNTLVAIRLARTLGSRVEELFPCWEGIDLPFSPGPFPQVEGGRRVVLADVRGRLIPYPVERLEEGSGTFVAADALLPGGDRGGQWTLLSSSTAIQRSALFLGCDPGIGLLVEKIATVSRDRLRWISCASETAAAALGAGQAHLAGCHLPGGELRNNRVLAREALQGFGGILIRFAQWEEGLAVARGNPLGIRSVEDLAHPGLRFLNRDAGSGSRALLDDLLRKRGIPGSAIPGYEKSARNPVAAARAVAFGVADASWTNRACAQAENVEFIPLGASEFDWIVPMDQVDHPMVALLLDLLCEARMQAEFAALPGYDVSRMGTVAARFAKERQAAS
ncbi:substrate-binding domain-containing protein [Methylacidimicrobium sp. B4]|uniref:substrate-binding domain-containing protein n=1 Tax=Methylacidimicrobium sp. B4 TaxID=2796139 RepID=UPI001A8C8B9E|nr:substrate-binding domain-containing protein [Methylacidimicrobium sp. B4]QSR84502.1 helix-turn-helix domain-containing protein [Methylacidimicrobium sp. B4]